MRSSHICLGDIGFFFLGAYSADNTYMCDVLRSVVGDLQFVDKLNGVGAFLLPEKRNN